MTDNITFNQTLETGHKRTIVVSFHTPDDGYNLRDFKDITIDGEVVDLDSDEGTMVLRAANNFTRAIADVLGTD